jgi:hypothetical protein
MRQRVSRFAGRQHGRQVAGLLRAHDAVEPRQLYLQHLLVEEQQRGQRLVLRRRRHLAVHGQVREERLDLGGRHVGPMPLAWNRMKRRTQDRYCCSARQLQCSVRS